MKRVELTFETITPLFMGGKTIYISDIRIPSFKGVWRWWWRASNGGLADYEQLKNQEDEVWGNTKKAGDVYFSLQANLKNLDISQKFVTDFDHLWYLWFTIAKYRSRRGETGLSQANKVQYVQPKQCFKIVLLSKNENALSDVLSSIWLATYLGGYGKRSRRGAGNLQVVDIKSDFEVDLDFFVKDDLEMWFAKNLNKIGKQKESIKCRGWKMIDSIYLDLYYHDNWEDALDVVGGIYREFRYNYRRKARAVFGLPLPGVSRERWASPVIFKVWRLPDGKFVPGVVFLKPECEQWLPIKKADFSVLNEFKNALEENDFQIAWQ